MIVKHRRGTTREWQEVDLIPEEGELVIEVCADGTQKCKIGTGYTKFSKLPYIDDQTRRTLLKEISNTKAELENKITDVETHTLAELSLLEQELSKVISTKTCELENAFTTADAAIKTELSEEIKSTARMLAFGTDAAISRAVGQGRKELSAAKTDFENALAALAEESTSNKASLDKALSTEKQERKEADEELRKAISTTNSSLSAQIVNAANTVSRNLSTAIENTSGELSKEIDALDNKLAATEKTLNEKVETQGEDFNSRLAETETNLAADYNKKVAELKVDSVSLAASVENLSARINKVNTENTELASNIADRLDATIEYFDEKISTQADLIPNQIKEASASLSAELRADYANKINAVEQAFTKQLDEIDREHSSILQDLQNYADEVVDSKLAEQQSVIDGLTASYNTLANDTIELSNDVTAKYDELNQTIVEATKTTAEKFDTELTNSAAMLTVYVDQETARVEDSLTAQLQSAKDAFDSKLANQETTFSGQLLNTAADLAKELTADYDTKIANRDKVLQAQISSLDFIHNQAMLDLRSTLTNATEAIDDRINSQQSEISHLNDLCDELKAIDGALSDAINVLEEQSAYADAAAEAKLAALEVEAINLLYLIQGVNKSIIDTGSSFSDRIENLQLDITDALEATYVTEVEDGLPFKEKLIKQLSRIKEAVFEKIQDIASNEDITSLTADVIAAKAAVANLTRYLTTTDMYVASVENKVNVQANRIDTIIAMPDEINPEDSRYELADIRNGYDGRVYTSAGAAVRAIGDDLEELKDSLPSYIPDNAVDGLEYVDNQLYLVSKGTQVGNAVTITGGTGGGGSTVKVQNKLPSLTIVKAKGEKVELRFIYTSIEDGVETGDGDYTVIVKDSYKEELGRLSGKALHGEETVVNISEYLVTGENTAIVTCVDQFGGQRSLTYTINIVELRIEAVDFDSTKIFDSTITFKYKVFGLDIKKTAYVCIDGEPVKTAELSKNVHNQESTAEISPQSHGSHELTAYLVAEVDGVDTTSNILRYELICIDKNETEKAILTSTCSVEELTQGDLISIPYMVYDPDPNLKGQPCKLTLSISSKVNGAWVAFSESEVDADSGKTYYWSTRTYPSGEVRFEIKYKYEPYGEETILSKCHTIRVEELSFDISAETDALQLYLTAAGRTNAESDHPDTGKDPAVTCFETGRNSWTYKSSTETITTSFSNFNWKSNGWKTDANGDTCLRINGAARAIINFNPFLTNVSALGKTIEFEFLVRDVNKRDTVIIDCFDDEEEIGFRATPDTAFLKSSGTMISCRYKDNERVRVAISVDDDDTLTRFVSIYLDGILSGVQRFSIGDNFAHSNGANTGITLGSDFCELDLYAVRVYGKSLSIKSVLDNYIADQALPSVKEQLLNDNNILNKDTNKISYRALKAVDKIPIITFTGDMPTYKGDKKVVVMDFINPSDHNRDFEKVYGGPIKVEIDVQGTSSQYYARKNWKIKLEKKAKDANGDTLKDANGKTVYEFKNAAYQHMEGQIPSKVFCIKVDYAEATGTHNTGTANYVETLYDRTATKDDEGSVVTFNGQGWIPPQKDTENEDATKIRTTIAGFPCVIFERPANSTNDDDFVFSSKGNFNFDKGSEDAFGFTEDYDYLGVECWEFCNNTSASVNFTGAVPESWENDFEPRYVPESAKFERIEKLLEKKQLSEKDPPEATMTDEEKNELKSLQSACISNFKQMHDWVLSTATYKLTNGEQTSIVLKNDAEILCMPEADRGNFVLPKPVDYGGKTYSYDTEEYRLAKFTAEFTQYFNLHYSCIYYIYTFFALMTDQRAKNMFLTRWLDGGTEENPTYHWYPYFYDNDTIFGINNEGALVFDYYHEDIDRLGSSNVYNGQNSVLWNNFRRCFASDIRKVYADLRSNKKLDYDKIMNYYVTQGSDKWSATIYNEDAEYKYLSMARYEHSHKEDVTNKESETVYGIDASNLYQVRGPGEHHLRYFVSNRLNYCDSKWNAGDYPSNFFFLRIYTPAKHEIDPNSTPEEQAEQLRINNSVDAVPPDPSIKVVPFSNMYAGVKYKANGTLLQKRLNAGDDTYAFSPPVSENPDDSETFNDTETAIYGASELSSLGDLSKLYCGVVNLAGKNTGDASGKVDSSAEQGNVKENKLTELIIGNHNANYYNDNFREIYVGTCRLLKKIDLTNCSGLGKVPETKPQKTLELAGCPNIEEIYAMGTNLSSIELPDSGYLKKLHLPASINTIAIKNQLYISEFLIENNDYSNVRTIRIENCPTLDTTNILNKCKKPYDPEHPNSVDQYTVQRVSLTGIDWNFENTDFVKSLFAKYDTNGNFIGGIREQDANGAYVDAYLKGTCYFTYLTGEDYVAIEQRYKDLVIKYGQMDSNVTFVDTDGTTVLKAVPVTAYNSETLTCEDPGYYGEGNVPAGKFKPVKESTAEFDYKFVGWALTKDGQKHYSALTGITGDRVLYPAFEAIRRSYPIKFINPSTTGDVELAEISTLYGTVPNYFVDGRPEPTKLDGASPSLYKFVCWVDADGNTLSAVTGDATYYAQFEVKDFDGDELPGYTIGWADITNCLDYEGNPLNGNGKGYTINTSNSTISITECNNNFNAAIRIPETMTTADGSATYRVISLGGFKGHDKLELITLPNNLIELRSNAFEACANLYEINLPQSLLTIRASALQSCIKLKELVIPASVQTIEDAALASCANLEQIIVSEGSTKFRVEGGCLIDNNGRLIQGLASSDIPDSVASLGAYCFAGMPIERVKIPDGISTIANNAFSNCKRLISVELPSTIQTLDATCFAWCDNLSEIYLPEGLTHIMTYIFHSCALKRVTIPSSVSSINDRAFGSLTKLEKVTFVENLDGKIPDIHYAAFYDSGSNLVFELPWTLDQHLAKFKGTYTDHAGKTFDKDIFFGAKKGSTFKFKDETEVVKQVEGVQPDVNV